MAGSKSQFLINGTVKDPGGINHAYPGDVITFYNPGGGGYGDPRERDPELVRRDVIYGYVSPENAKEYYGVVIDPETGKVDDHATAKQRCKA
jgi:N-methylhydantoinase B